MLVQPVQLLAAYPYWLTTAVPSISALGRLPDLTKYSIAAQRAGTRLISMASSPGADDSRGIMAGPRDSGMPMSQAPAGLFHRFGSSGRGVGDTAGETRTAVWAVARW